MRPRLRAILVCSLCLGACERSSTRSPEPEPEAPSVEQAAASAARDDEHAMAYGERTIYVYADPALAPEVARLFALFEDLQAEQVPIDRTTRLPIGWTTLSFAAEGARLFVEEPDYANQPETRTRRDVSVSLRTLARQRAVLEHAGVAGQPIDFDQHVLAFRGALEAQEVFLLRVESPGGRMTGWRLSPNEEVPEDAEVDSLPVYEILAARPALLDAMLLPVGYMAFYSGDTLTTVVNEHDEVVCTWGLDGPEIEREREPEREPVQPLLQPID
ncbi:MAG: hypothetical protein R6X02_28660 [Enhygromyxa sp.]